MVRQPIGSLSRLRERVRVRARSLRQSAPDAERALWNELRNRRLGGNKFRRQHPIDRYFADFACVEAKLVVEIDGDQHFEPQAMDADEQRTASLNRAGFSVLRFTSREALAEQQSVLCSILEWLHRHFPHPHPLPDPLPQAGEGVNAKDTP